MIVSPHATLKLLGAVNLVALCIIQAEAHAQPLRKPVINQMPCVQLNKSSETKPCEEPPEPPNPVPQGGIPNGTCCQTSEVGLCSDGIDNDCDGYCDLPGSSCSPLGTRQVLAGDPDCCPDDTNPCTKPIMRNGGCAQLFIPGCSYCEVPEDCFDGNEETLDYCVSGKCVWIGS